jgi:hypothetical protein
VKLASVLRTSVARYGAPAMIASLVLGVAYACSSSTTSSSTPAPMAAPPPSGLIRAVPAAIERDRPAATPAPTPASQLPAGSMSMTPQRPDPRVGLRPGTWDTATRRVVQPAAEAIWNLRLVSNSPPPAAFAGVTNSDLAFTRNYAIQGNYNGYAVWDISNPRAPTMTTAFLCPASQSDVSVYKNLLFVSGEGQSGRTDCGTQGLPDSVRVSPLRLRGIRVMDVSDMSKPKYVGNVQTCRGSHTHTVVSDMNDPNNVYVYISGSSGVRDSAELPGCRNIQDINDPNTSLFRIEVIQVPLSNPTQAKVVGEGRIFHDLVRGPGHGPSRADSVDAAAHAAYDAPKQTPTKPRASMSTAGWVPSHANAAARSSTFRVGSSS